MTDRKEHPLKWMIELFSVVTGGAFVFSALTNAIMFFGRWNINYFSVASPSDVVMSGFLVFTGFISFFVFLFIISLIFTIVWYVITTLSQENSKIHPIKRIPSVVSSTSRVAMEAMISATGAKAFALMLFIGILGYSSIAWSRAITSMFWNETGLNVIDQPGDNSCDGAHVLWLGSSSAVLECKDGVRVIHNLDGLETVRRYR